MYVHKLRSPSFFVYILSLKSEVLVQNSLTRKEKRFGEKVGKVEQGAFTPCCHRITLFSLV